MWWSDDRTADHHAGGRWGAVRRVEDVAAGRAVALSYSSARYFHGSWSQSRQRRSRGRGTASGIASSAASEPFQKVVSTWRVGAQATRSQAGPCGAVTGWLS